MSDEAGTSFPDARAATGAGCGALSRGRRRRLWEQCRVSGGAHGGGHPYVVGVPEGRTWTKRNRHVTPVSVASHFLVYQQFDGKVSG